MTGPNSGLIEVKVKGHTVATSGRLWAFASYSRFIRPGAVRIAATTSRAGLEAIAVRNRRVSRRGGSEQRPQSLPPHGRSSATTSDRERHHPPPFKRREPVGPGLREGSGYAWVTGVSEPDDWTSS